MPNPRAQRQLTLDRVVSDLKSFAQPAQAMGDMMAGALRGSVAGTVGAGGDIRELIDLFGPEAVEKVLGKRVMPTTEEMKQMLPPAVPQSAPASRQHTAGVYGDIGEFLPTPMSGTLAKAGMYGLGRGAGTLTRGAGQAINDAVLHNTGPLAQGSLSFLAPKTATMHIIKPKGGNWLKGSAESGTKGLKTNERATENLEEMRRVYPPEVLANMSEETREQVNRGFPHLEKQVAINNWIDSNLANYVKKEMGTEADPIRKLAEQDITHLPKDLAEPNVEAWTPDELAEARVQAGFPAEGVGKSNLAQMWEQMADQSIYPYKAKDFQTVNKLVSKQNQAIYDMQKLEEEAKVLARKNLIEKLPDQSPEGIDIILRNIDNPTMYELAGSDVAKKINKLREKIFQYEVPQVGFRQRSFEENPWLTKVDPETDIYHAQTGGLGFDHVVDVLKQDLAEGRIRPEQLNKVSMEQAVRRTYEYDQEMARKMAEAQIKATEGMPVHKEYPEGFKWVELSVPNKLPEKFSVSEKNGRFNIVDATTGDSLLLGRGRTLTSFNTPEEAISAYYKQNPKVLEEALKYEGDTMGHCVGGYCPDVLEGRTRIFSLRDPRGEPHVTVEVKPNQHLDFNTWWGKQPKELQDEINARARRGEHKGSVYEAPEYLSARDALPPAIKQIKGKQNAAPKEQYLPYVQDFVRGGDWSDVGDLKNTGLSKFGSDYLTHAEAETKYKPMVSEALNFLETHPALEQHRLAQKAYDEFSGAIPSPEYTELQAGAGKPISKNVPYTYNELKALLKNPEDWTDYGGSKYEPIANAVQRINQAKKELGIDIPPPAEAGMKKGGKVSVSNNCDCQHMDVMDQHMSGGGALSKAAIEALERMKALKPEFQARTNLLNKYKAETASIPYNEVKPFQMTNEQIREEMDRMAREQAQREQSKAKGGAVELANGGEVRGYDNGGSIKATPRNEAWGTAADLAKWIEEHSKEQFGYKNPATEVISDFLGVPAVARTLERKAYGEPLTNIGKANVPMIPDDTAEAAMVVAPFAGKAGKGAKALGKAGLSEVEKAMFGESNFNLLNAATPQVMSVYKPHTPLKPDPDVGTRYKKQYVGGLAPRKDLDIEDLEKSSVKIFPWDATSRNQLITEVSDVPLTNPVLTEGGDEYMMDLQHIANRIAGASNEGIAKRIVDRINQASVENQILGGTGKVYGFPIRMGEGAENAATFPADVVMDLFNQAGLKKKEIKDLDTSMRNMLFEGEKSAFKNMAPIGTPEFEQQLKSGLKSDKEKKIIGFTSMNLRKALMNRLGLVEYQKRLGYNLPDLTGAVLSDELKGVPKGYVGNVAAELDPFTSIRPSKSSTYSHDFSGQYAGSMPNMPVEFLMPNVYEAIYREMKEKYPKFSHEALRNMTIGAMEKRKDKISELIGPRSVDAVKTFQEGLMQGNFDPYDINQVYDYMRRKKLGLNLDLKKPLKKSTGGAITGDDLIIEERPL